MTSGSTITLREVTQENLRAILALKVAAAQGRFVASNATSIAEAHFYPEAWFMAVYAGEEPVGFVMLHDENRKVDPEIKDFYALWRIMIDARYQGMGYGAKALQLVVQRIMANPDARELLVSYIPGEGSPEGFYSSFGFEHTGKEIHGETEMMLKLR